MNIDYKKANKTLLELTKAYQSIKYKNMVIEVPYFINTAEQAYKQAMRNVGIDKELINKAITSIKNGETVLGSSGGKGTPAQIQADFDRFVIDINSMGYFPDSPHMLRCWMSTMHIGLDCAGYIFNILSAVEKDQNIDITNRLAWTDRNSIKPSHAGVFIFDSDELETVNDLSKLQPLDIILQKDLTHIGIISQGLWNTEISNSNNNSLFLAECAMGAGGVKFSELTYTKNKVLVENGSNWTELFNSGAVIIKRL